MSQSTPVGGREGGLTLPWVTTLTDPFQIMYHEVPLSPWLNTDRNIDQICPLLSPTTAPGLQTRWPAQLTHGACLAVWFEEQNSSQFPLHLGWRKEGQLRQTALGKEAS